MLLASTIWQSQTSVLACSLSCIKSEQIVATFDMLQKTDFGHFQSVAESEWYEPAKHKIKILPVQHHS